MLVRLKNSLLGLFSFAAGAGLLYTSMVYEHVGPAEENPMLFPKYLAIAWCLLSFLIFCEDVRKSRPVFNDIAALRFWGVVMLLGMAAVLMPVLGFIPVSVLFFVAYAYVTGFRKIPLLIAVSIVFTAAAWGVFNYLLEIPLPTVPFME